MARAGGRAVAGALVIFAAALAGCGPGSPPASSGGRVSVVAAEDMWGSIAAQVGGERVTVRNLISNPNTDPHDYEPTAADGRAVALAQVVVVNGIGYDPWAGKLLGANPSSGRVVVNVGDVVGLEAGANPHQWYSRDAVDKVIGALVSAFQKVDARHRADYDRLRSAFVGEALSSYRSAIDDLRARYGGTPVGASESLFAPLAAETGLELVTPRPFLDAITQGHDPTAADKATVDRQIATRTIKAFLFNSQNATPDVRRLVDAARANGIPVVTMTETLTPKGTSFQAWQTLQLRALASALGEATGR